MTLLTFAWLVVFTLCVDGHRRKVELNVNFQRLELTRDVYFAGANKLENQSFGDASSTQEHEELVVGPISSTSEYPSSTQFSTRIGLASMGSYDTSSIWSFYSEFEDRCSGNSDARFHINDGPETDQAVVEADRKTHWHKFIDTQGITGCNGLYTGREARGDVCHVVLKLVIAAVSEDPLAGLAGPSSKGKVFYMVCKGGRKFYGSSQWSSQWSHKITCKLAPESVLDEEEDGSFKESSDVETTLIPWSCGVPEMPKEVNESTPVVIQPIAQEKVAQYEKIERQALQNHSSSEMCCCAEIREGEMRAFGVQLRGIPGGSDVALAVGHSGMRKGEKGSASCPVIGGLEHLGTPCSCTRRETYFWYWAAPKACASKKMKDRTVEHPGAVGSHSPGSFNEVGKTLKCIALCSTPLMRSSISQVCKDKIEMGEIEMTTSTYQPSMQKSHTPGEGREQHRN